jgi:hypothetical protein
MKPVAIGAASLLLIGVASWLLLGDEPQSTPESASAAAPGPGSAAAVSKPTIVDLEPADKPGDVAYLRKRIKNLQSTLRDVVTQRASAEADLQQAERDVTELERFIDEIKARGEDPADYADEGLAMFQPAFYAYQNAFDKLELAEAMEQAAAEELAAAEAELESTLAAANISQ